MATTRLPVEGDIKKFYYEARDADGKKVTGQAQASNETQVIREIEGRGWTPLKVKEGAGGIGTDMEITLRKYSQHRSLVIASRMLETCLEAGLQVKDTIDILRAECEDRILADGLSAVKRDLDNGRGLSDAMRRQPNAFPEMMVNMIKAGEVGGFVPKAAAQVADNFEAEDALRAKVKKAVMYPAVVMGLSGAIFIFMMVYIVPTFAGLYDSMSNGKAELPVLTQMVVAVSEGMVWILPTLAVLIAIFFFWWRKYGKTQKVREVWDPLKFKIPVFGQLFHKIALTRFTRNLSSLLKAGVPNLEALEITAETVGNSSMRKAILAARDAQMKGRPLVEPLRDEPLFPPMVIQMVTAGEKTGRTSHMLGKTAAIYDRDVNTITDNLTALIEPFFIVILGVMVGIISIAIYLPYLNIGNLM